MKKFKSHLPKGEGMPIQDIARKIGITPQAVRMILIRSIKKLKIEFENRGITENPY